LSYIGKTPTVGNFIKLDAITTSSTNSYTLQHNSVNFSPESALHMMVSLNGVIQAPNTSYTVSGSTITFLPSSGTLSSSDSIDFIMVYGNILDLGVASSVTDSSITKGKLNLISDSSSAGLTVKGDGSSENGTIQLNCSQNTHGVKISSPAHSSGQSYELILPTGNVTADKVLKVASVSGSGATGIGQLSFGDAGGSNTPAFSVYKNSNFDINDATETKVAFDTETYDTDSAFASNKFTVPSGAGGKYFFYSRVRFQKNGVSEYSIIIKKNNSDVAKRYIYSGAVGTTIFTADYFSFDVSCTLNLSATDYVEVFIYMNSTDGGACTVNGGSTHNEFTGYKIIE
jgi:hypothetical protein